MDVFVCQFSVSFLSYCLKFLIYQLIHLQLLTYIIKCFTIVYEQMATEDCTKYVQHTNLMFGGKGPKSHSNLLVMLNCVCVCTADTLKQMSMPSSTVSATLQQSSLQLWPFRKNRSSKWSARYCTRPLTHSLRHTHTLTYTYIHDTAFLCPLFLHVGALTSGQESLHTLG